MSLFNSLLSKTLAGTFQLRQHLADHCTTEALNRIMAYTEILYRDMVVDAGAAFTPLFQFTQTGPDRLVMTLTRATNEPGTQTNSVDLRIVSKADGYADGLELVDDGTISEYENWIAFRAGLMEQGVRRFYDRLPPHTQKTLHEFIRFTGQTADIYQAPSYHIRRHPDRLTLTVLDNRKQVCSFSINL